MLYFKQVVAAAVILICIGALMEKEIINAWLFSGLGGWICIVVPLGAISISIIQLLKDDPPKKVEKEDWRKNFQTDSFFPVKHDLSAQRIHRSK